MKFFDVFIQCLVFVVVMSLLFVVLGIMLFICLMLCELLVIDLLIVLVLVDYIGVFVVVIESCIIQVLEDVFVGIEGIDIINVCSFNGCVQVSIEFIFNCDIEVVVNDVCDVVSWVVDCMFEEVWLLEIVKVESDVDFIIWFNMSLIMMDMLELSDYVDCYVVDCFFSLDGVVQVCIGGCQCYVMWIWLDCDQFVVCGLIVGDVEIVLCNENVELLVGWIELVDCDFILCVECNYVKFEDFVGILLGKGVDGYVVCMGDVVRIELVLFECCVYYCSNGEFNIGLGIVKIFIVNVLDVVCEVCEEVECIGSMLLQGMWIFVVFDNIIFIEVVVDCVYVMLVEVMLLVLVVIWLFFGSFCVVLIFVVIVLVCLVVVFIVLYVFGFLINLFILLVLVLCIGLVVDDVIVVVENVQCCIDFGELFLVVFKCGIVQVVFVVIVIMVVLVVVFLLVGFFEGNIGCLFCELVVVFVVVVVLFVFVLLMLILMMVFKLFKLYVGQLLCGLYGVINCNLDCLLVVYGWVFDVYVGCIWIYIVVMVLLLLVSVVLLKLLLFELVLVEDCGLFQIMIDGFEGVGFDYMVGQVQQVEKIVFGFVGEDKLIVCVNLCVFGGFGVSEEMYIGCISVFLQLWCQCDVFILDVVVDLQIYFNDLCGVCVCIQVGGGLVCSQGQLFQIVFGGFEYVEIVQWWDCMLLCMVDNFGLVGVDLDYKEICLQMWVNINCQCVVDLGVLVIVIGSVLEMMMGLCCVIIFVDNGEEYDVLVQVGCDGCVLLDDLVVIWVWVVNGVLILLFNLVMFSEVVEVGNFNWFNWLCLIIISVGLVLGYLLGEVIVWVQQIVCEELLQYVQIDWKGELCEYQNVGSVVLLIFVMVLLVVYLVLVVQFESFIYLLVIMLIVLLGVFGVLLGLYVSGGMINLFSQIGIVMLVGLVVKNGILIVEFVNQFCDEGCDVYQVIVELVMVCLCLILMIFIVIVVGVILLVVVGGFGLVSCGIIGIVVIFGVIVFIFLFLFVVFVFYLLLVFYMCLFEVVVCELVRQEVDILLVGGYV